jgi:sialate O-acetylesterase
MKITHGLMAGQVLQRDRRGLGHAKITGTTHAAGDVEIRAGKSWQVAGKAKDGEFQAHLTGLKTGGPYRVQLRIGKERLTVRDVFVGDVWILAGQSNMEGVGNLCDAPKPHPLVRCFSMADEWRRAEEPLHYRPEAVDAVHAGPNPPNREALERGRKALLKGVSPGLAFGLEMYRRTGVPQGLLACAHGGTSMAQWSPALRDKGGESLYGAMYRRYVKLGQPVAGMLWYQGESDANAEAVAKYMERMKELVAAVRRDTGLPRLPWYMVQIGRHTATEDPHSWNGVQEQQRRLPAVIHHLDVVPAVDLELDDGIHISGRAQQILGRRLARLTYRPGLALEKMELVPTPVTTPAQQAMSLRLTYRNVAGRLESAGLPAGFALLNKHGHDTLGIFKTTLHGNQVLLHTGMVRAQLERMTVSYGHGRLPHCNITDRAGMGLPAMQAVPVPHDKSRAPDCDHWQTTLLRGVKTLAEASWARVSRATGWRPAPLREPFGVLPKPADDKRVGVYVLRATVTATERLDAMLKLAANAPFKLWCNGRLVWTDPAARVPIDPDKYKVRLPLRRGKNELRLAFAPPSAGRHLGIFARIGSPRGKLDPRIQL